MARCEPGEARWVWVNEQGRHIADDLNEVLASAAGSRTGATLWTGHLSVRGLLELLPGMQSLTRPGTRLRILCGVSPDESATLTVADGLLHVTKEEMKELLRTADQHAWAEINSIPLSQRRILQLLELSDVLNRPEVECRREETRTFHAKGALLHLDVVMVGSANLSASGLRWNRELTGPLHPQARPQVVAEVEGWWQQAQPYPLDALIHRRLRPYQPELIYLKILDCLYGDQVNYTGHPHLRPWQRDGVAQALRSIDQHGGVLNADDVGIGKTDQALAIATHLHHTTHGRTLILCPAGLRTWWSAKLQDSYELPGDVVSYEKLAHDYDQPGREAWRTYATIICDEAHRLRNPDTLHRRALQELIDHQPDRPTMILMTATPVNNHALDLYELLCLADPTLEGRWAPTTPTSSARGRRSGTGKLLLDLCLAPPESDTPQALRLQRILDARMVRCTRALINTHYAESRRHFPQRHHAAVTYTLTPHLRALTGDVLDALDAAGISTADPHLHQLRGPQPRLPPLTLAAFRRWPRTRRGGRSGRAHPPLELGGRRGAREPHQDAEAADVRTGRVRVAAQTHPACLMTRHAG